MPSSSIRGSATATRRCWIWPMRKIAGRRSRRPRISPPPSVGRTGTACSTRDPAKTERSLDRALAAGTWLVADSEQDAEAILARARAVGAAPRYLLRFRARAAEASQRAFGLAPSRAAGLCARLAREGRPLPSGLAFHLGTGLLSARPFVSAVREAARLAGKLRRCRHPGRGPQRRRGISRPRGGPARYASPKVPGNGGEFPRGDPLGDAPRAGAPGRPAVLRARPRRGRGRVPPGHARHSGDARPDLRGCFEDVARLLRGVGPPRMAADSQAPGRRRRGDRGPAAGGHRSPRRPREDRPAEGGRPARDRIGRAPTT